MNEYDVYLNGKGFMLAKDGQGRIASSAAREVIVDPFTRQLSASEPYTRIPFRFGDGAGLTQYDGSARYEWGNNIDARSGRAILAPAEMTTGAPWIDRKMAVDQVSVPENISTGSATIGIAERFVVPASVTKIRSVFVLCRRHPDSDFDSAGTYSVGIAENATDRPGTAIAYVNTSLRAETWPYAQFPDRLRSGEFFWVEAIFPTAASVTAGNPYWVYVINDQVPIFQWEQWTPGGSTAAKRSHWSGGGWVQEYDDYGMMLRMGCQFNKMDYVLDSQPRYFTLFRGVDNLQRLYCATNYRVIAFATHPKVTTWCQGHDCGAPVLGLKVFNSKMFIACGPLDDMIYTDGTSVSENYQAVTGEQAVALAVHDNMLWKADIRSVKGSLDGTTWTGAAVEVGEPGTPVQSMVSHGGKLFAAKPEGIFEISYPDTYPGSGTPTSNLMLDFYTERCSRTWILDWHSGLYFPGLGGVYELKGGVLRNLWEDKVDENAIDVRPANPVPEGVPWLPPVYTRPRSWAPLYDKGPVVWTMAHGTTRGIIFVRTNAHMNTSDLLWYDGRNWFSLWAPDDTDTLGVAKYVGEYVTACFVQDIGGGRGWLWHSSGPSIERREWPTWTNDTVDDGNVNYCTRGQLTTPWYSLPVQSQEFLLCKVAVVSRNLEDDGDTITAQISYKVDDDLTWTTLGTADTSPFQELSFPANTTARRIQFRIVLYTSDSTVTPIIEQLDLLYQTLPELTRTHQLLIDCSPDQSLHSGGVDERGTREIVDDIKALVGTSSFAYVDLLGASHTVRIVGLTHQPMNTTADPGAGVGGTTSQVVLSLIELL